MAESKYAKGIYNPKHPEKYIGTKDPVYRSSWELVFFNFADNHPSVIQWASEAIRIPYINPLTGANSIYIPDLFMVYQDRYSKRHAEVIEIKPLKESALEYAKTKRDKAALAVNMVKWQCAQKWCAAKGFHFRVLTEQQLFQQKVK